jgi:hypothetical protein
VQPLFLLLLILTTSASAETVAIPFTQPEGFPLSFRLLVPKQDSAIVSHKKENGADTITARITDDKGGGLIVEALDAESKRVWISDFGYNLSAVPGCSVSVAFHPKLSALIVSYQGYKWDHSHKLLFVKKEESGHVVSEYSPKAPEIASFIKKQDGYSSDHKYHIYPYKFEQERVVFECVPAELPERKAERPFAQDVPWFHVTASISPVFVVAPTHVEKAN